MTLIKQLSKDIIVNATACGYDIMNRMITSVLTGVLNRYSDFY